MIIATILGSQKLEEFDLIKTMPTKEHAAPTLSPNVNPILTLFLPDADHEDAPMNPQQIMSTFSVLIMVVLILALVIVFLWKCFHFASNIMRTCFPWFPYSTYCCSIAKADMSHFTYTCKMQYPLNLVLENSEYLIVILDYGLKLHKLLNHTLVMLQK